MEWIRRNPKAAAGLSALVVLCVVILVWGISRGQKASGTSALGDPGLAVPTTTPTRAPLTVLPSASASASSSPSVAGFGSLNASLANVGEHGTGAAHSLEPHTVQLLAGADNGLAALGWRMPHAKGATGGVDKHPGRYWSLTKTELGLPAYSGLYTYVGEVRGKVWCTIKVDGKVVDHREARGPWGQVYCGI